MTEEKRNFSTLIQFRKSASLTTLSCDKDSLYLCFPQGNVMSMSMFLISLRLMISRSELFFAAVVHSNVVKRQKTAALQKARNNGTIRQEANINPLSSRNPPCLDFFVHLATKVDNEKAKRFFFTVNPHTTVEKLSLCLRVFTMKPQKAKSVSMIWRKDYDAVVKRRWRKSEQKLFHWILSPPHNSAFVEGFLYAIKCVLFVFLFHLFSSFGLMWKIGWDHDVTHSDCRFVKAKKRREVESTKLTIQIWSDFMKFKWKPVHSVRSSNLFPHNLFSFVFFFTSSIILRSHDAIKKNFVSINLVLHEVCWLYRISFWWHAENEND